MLKYAARYIDNIFIDMQPIGHNNKITYFNLDSFPNEDFVNRIKNLYNFLKPSDDYPVVVILENKSLKDSKSIKNFEIDFINLDYEEFLEIEKGIL